MGRKNREQSVEIVDEQPAVEAAIEAAVDAAVEAAGPVIEAAVEAAVDAVIGEPEPEQVTFTEAPVQFIDALLERADKAGVTCVQLAQCANEEELGRLCASMENKAAPEASFVPDPEQCSVIHLENRIPKKRMFLADVIRDERDRQALSTELRKKCYKGRIVRVTTVKHYELVDDCWLTEFEIELK